MSSSGYCSSKSAVGTKCTLTRSKVNRVAQTAQKQAETFHEACNVTGIVMTKMDGTAKGGGALTACAVTNAKVKFIGIGERVDDLEKYVSHIEGLLGVGSKNVKESCYLCRAGERHQECVDDNGKRLTFPVL